MRSATVRALIAALVCAALAVPAMGEQGDGDGKEGVRLGVGAGLGIPYGVLGVEGDVGVGPVEFTAGLGLVGWNLGARIYPSLKTNKRGDMEGFRFDVFYGVNTILEDVWYDEWDSLTGLTVGVGGRFGPFDVDLLVPFADIPGGYERASYDWPVKISVGLHLDLTK